MCDAEKDRQIRLTGIKTDIETDRQAYKHTDIQEGIQTHRHTQPHTQILKRPAYFRS